MVRFGCAQSLIVTFDKERDIETPEGLISVRPAWKWLLEAGARKRNYDLVAMILQPRFDGCETTSVDLRLLLVSLREIPSRFSRK